MDPAGARPGDGGSGPGEGLEQWRLDPAGQPAADQCRRTREPRLTGRLCW